MILAASSTKSSSVPSMPKWSSRRKDRVAWSIFVLETYPELYEQFETLANAKRLENRDKQFGVENVLQDLRWAHRGRKFKFNNNARALFSRLYIHFHPDARIKIRQSWLDQLDPDEWQTIARACGKKRSIDCS
jgi:hypothetical protein